MSIILTHKQTEDLLKCVDISIEIMKTIDFSKITNPKITINFNNGDKVIGD